MALHHYVPQFLLRGFADERSQLRVVARASNEPSYVTTVKRAAAEKGYYRIPSEDVIPESRTGHNPEIVEESFAALEARASEDIRRIVAGQSHMSLDLHYRMSTFVALQLARGPRFRRDYIDIANLSARAYLDGRLTDDRLRRHLAERGQPTDPAAIARLRSEIQTVKLKLVPPAAHLVQETVRFGVETFGPLMFQRIPRILRFTEPLLLTSDVGAAPWSPTDRTPWTNGIAFAHTIFFPLGRKTVYALARVGSPLDRLVPAIWADHSNFAMANAAERWIYQNPKDNHLLRIDVSHPQNDRWGSKP